MEVIFEIIKKEELSTKELQVVDNFILSEYTSGEFINSSCYLSYHPEGRFVDDSVIVRDIKSKTIRGVFMAAQDPDDKNIIISHPGTTFAGIVIDRKLSIEKTFQVLSILLDYYEKKYKKIIIKLHPQWYDMQPIGRVENYLLSHGYSADQLALSNVINISNINTSDEVLRLFDSKRRNQVKKVINENKFHLCKYEDILEEIWINMNNNLKSRFDSKATHSYEEICELKGKFMNQIIPYYVFDNENNYGAFALIYKFKNVFHTQYLDLNYDYASYYPNLLLIFHLILEARYMGYEKFSFGPSTECGGKKINYGLYDYKAGYGGGDIVMLQYIKTT